MVDILVHGLLARNCRKSRILDDKSTPINQENCLQTSDLSGRSLVKRLKEPPSSAELVLVFVYLGTVGFDLGRAAAENFAKNKGKYDFIKGK